MSTAQDALDSIGVHTMGDSVVAPFENFDIAVTRLSEAVAGVVTLDLSVGGAADLVATANQIRGAVVVLSGATAARQVVVEDLPFKRLFVNNSDFAVTVKCAATAGIVVDAHSSAELWSDGTTVRNNQDSLLAKGVADGQVAKWNVMTGRYEPGTDNVGAFDLEAVQDAVAAMLNVQGVTATYDDAAGTYTIPIPVPLTQEQVEDIAANEIIAGSNANVNYDDVAGKLTISAANQSVAPYFSSTAPAAPASNPFWFDLSTNGGTMKFWDATNTVWRSSYDAVGSSLDVEGVQDIVGQMLNVSGANGFYDDANNKYVLTVPASLTREAIEDFIASDTVAGANMTVTYTDNGENPGTLTFSSTASTTTTTTGGGVSMLDAILTDGGDIMVDADTGNVLYDSTLV